jgi:gluconate 2-dehydrogenase gamma chain
MPCSQPVSEQLAAAETVTLGAVVDRLIPADDLGPGGVDAGVVDYIQAGLLEAFPAALTPYRRGLAVLEQHALAADGTSFDTLSPARRDELLGELEAGAAAWFPDGAAFFELVREHAIQGMFGDPRHGGNAGFAGWDLVGYPGARLQVEPADERLDAPTRIERLSVADHGLFDLDDERPQP